MNGQHRRALLTGSALVILVGCAMPAAAQQAAGSTPPPETNISNTPTEKAPVANEIVVVGSQIKGSKITSVLPVTVLDSKDIAATGAFSGDELMRAIPQMGDVTFNSGNNAQTSNSARGDVNSINLRNLGVGNTLVLLNGRRMVQHPVSQAGEGNVPVLGYNSNALPVAGIERVEVLLDGAAAIYGTDAVAGVVNTVTRTDFNGLSMNARYGYAQGTSRHEGEITGFAGHNFAGGRGNVSLFVDWTHRTAEQASDEPYTATANLRSYFADDPNFADNVNSDGRATQSPWANLAVVGASGAIKKGKTSLTSAAGAFHTQSIDDPGCLITINANTCLGSGTRATGTTLRNERYDTAIGTTVTPEVYRLNTYLTAHYDVTDTLTVYTELGLYRASTHAIQPATINLNAITIPASNYWNPFGPVTFADGTPNPNRIPGLTNVPAAGLPVTLSTYRYVDAGVQHVDVTNWQDRFLGGLKGKIGSFDFDSAVLYSEAQATDRSDAVNMTKLQQSLSLSTPDAYNPFSGGCAATTSSGDCTPSAQSAIDNILFKLRRHDRTTLTLGDFKLSNSHLLELPAGPVGIAMGVEARHETQEDDRDPNVSGVNQFIDSVTGAVSQSNTAAVSSSGSTKGSRTVFSAYGELAVPVISPEMHIPLVREVDLQLAGRYEHYSDFGSIAKPKVAAAWDVVDGVRFRGSWSQGFRAPNLEQVNTTQYARLGSSQDFYRCQASLDKAGNPTGNIASCGNTAYSILIAGNPNLKPETSTNWTAGIVLQPRFIPSRFGRVTITADFWSIHQVGIVGQFGPANALVLDNLLRQQGSSNPNVVRAPVNADDTAFYDGSGLPAAGAVVAIRDQFVNLLPQTVQGIDLAFLYSLHRTAIGDFDVSLNAARMTKYDRQNPPQIQALFDARASGTINKTTPLTDQGNLLEQDGKPKWRVSGTITWKAGPVQIGAFGTYVSSVYISDFLGDDGSEYKLKGQATFNLYAQYTFKKTSTLGTPSMRIGVRNLTNKQPPIDPDTGYLGSLYNPYGRFWYVSFGTRF